MQLKKVMAMMLAATLAVGLLAGCGSAETKESTSSATQKEEVKEEVKEESKEDSNEPVEVTYPVDTDVTLRVYVRSCLELSSAYTDFDDTPFCQNLEEKTGINIEWESAPAGSDPETNLNLVLQDEELPDIILGYGMSTSQIKDWLDVGIAQDISELMPVYAPDFTAYINDDSLTSQRNKDMMAIDGKITFFIGARDVLDGNMFDGLYIRKDWLDALGLEVPETIEEFDTVARAFHEEYGAYITGHPSRLNRMGTAASGVGAFAAYDMRYFMEDGVVKLANEQEEWKEYLTYSKEWYDDGILDVNFTAANDGTTRQAAADGSAGICVISCDYLDLFRADAEEFNTGAEWIPMAGLAEEKGGLSKFNISAYSTWNNSCGSFITTSCTGEKLAAAIQFLNYGYTEEGLLAWNYGIEGVSFEFDENGEPHFTDLIKKDPRGPITAKLDYTGATWMGTANLQLNAAVADAYGKGYGESLEVWSSNNVYAEYLVPTLTYTDEEKIIYDDLNAALATYVNEMAIKFVTGEESLDNFDNFVDTLHDMGLEDVLKIMNDAYQRSYAK